ncbi:hypothetical protein IFR05_017490, partial [Cadophora sp. M221]
DGRLDRRLLHPDPRMWWNEPGQERTSPSSDACYVCVVKHVRCDLGETGYPCTRCGEMGLGEGCRNGMPTQGWEREFIGRLGGAVAVGVGGNGNGNGDLDRGSGVGWSGNRSRCRERRDAPRPRRRRSASPRRDEEDDDDDEDVDINPPEEDDNDDEDDEIPTPKPKARGRGTGRPRNYKKRSESKSPPKKILHDNVYERMYGMKRKCQNCTRQKLTCTDARPCDRCRRTGRECVSMDGVPYTVQPPLPPDGDEVNYDDDDKDGEDDDDAGDGDGNGHRGDGYRRPVVRKTGAQKDKGKQRAQPDQDQDPDEDQDDDNMD